MSNLNAADDRAKNGPSNLCPVCGLLSPRQNRACANCSWHGAFPESASPVTEHRMLENHFVILWWQHLRRIVTTKIKRWISNMNIGASHVYLAGQTVPAGIYRQIEGSREIRIDREDVLPATCDGRVAAYVRLPETWGERQDRQDDSGQPRDDVGNPGASH